MRKADFIGGLTLIGLGLFMIFVIIPRETARGTWFGLSPYVIPTVFLVGIVIFSILLVVKSVSRPQDYGDIPPPVRWWQFAMFILSAAIIVAGVILIDRFGVWIGGPALIASVMLFMGERRPLRLVLTSTLPVAAIYVLAFYVLRIPLP